jgi:hypothetical protein
MTTRRAASHVGPRRAIWGLVNDGYALVAKTANLSHDDAFELCRVPDIGDPSGYLDQSVAYLRAPKWGHVFARYFTNAERDSAGRASLVYDVVALSDDDFAAIGNDAFRALPPLATDQRPERFGELAIPTLESRDPTTEAARVTTLLKGEDDETLAALLGALLAGDHVLCVAPGLRAETIECLTLLLPPVLRPSVTFQLPTVDFPKHTPRLAVAERGHALLVEREWSVVLPRDADDPRLAEARATAARLVALGRSTDRLLRAWATSAGAETPGVGAAVLGAADLHAAVAGVLRMDLLREGLRTGDVRKTVLVAARAETADERLWLADAIFEQATPGAVAQALVDVVRGDQRGAWSAVHAVSSGVAARREQQRERFEAFFTALTDGLRDVPRPPAEPQLRDPAREQANEVDVLLACAAASLGDLSRFLDVADPALPWETAWRDGTARWVKGRSGVARLFDALAARGATYGDTMDALQAIVAMTGTTHGRTRDRASSIALALVRRVLRERATLEPPDRLGAVVETLLKIWAVSPQASRAADDPVADVSRAVRRFLGATESRSTNDPRRVAAELSAVVADAEDGGTDSELLGWAIAALERAHAGTLGEGTIRAVAALLEERRRVGAGDAAPTVGRVLLHFAAADASYIFRPAWLDVVRQADDTSRRELVARALSWVTRGYATGRFTIGAFADACVVAGAEGVAIDQATCDLLVPHLVAAGERRTAMEIALLAGTVAAVATPAAAETLTTALLSAADESVADGVRMRRLALALHEIERVRDEDRHAQARATLRRVLARHSLAPDEEKALRVFLGVDDGTMIGKWLSRLPSLTPAGVLATGERR